MYQAVIRTLLLAIMLSFFAGCAGKTKNEYDKSAIYWYQKIMRSVAANNVDKSDDYFTSLESEHIGSPLIPQAMLILVQAHIDNQEYLLANFYLDEYIKRYGTFKNQRFAKFMKIKTAFLGLSSPQRDQKMIDDTLKKAKNYISRYPKSEYTPMVQTMEVRLEMTRYIMNENIAGLYHRRNKDRAAKIYEARNTDSWLKKDDIQAPSHGWLGWLFD